MLQYVASPPLVSRNLLTFSHGLLWYKDHDILWDIGYAKVSVLQTQNLAYLGLSSASFCPRSIRECISSFLFCLSPFCTPPKQTWEEATLNLDNLYGERPPIEDFWEWRDLRVLDECYWYSWFIDYWMEGGLQRDIFTHKTTTPEHWNMLMMPTVYTRAELDYDVVVGNDTVVTDSYDPHCGNGEISNGCAPVAVISAEVLRDPTEGKAETAKIANVLLSDSRTGQYVIAEEAWDCIWSELIQNGKVSAG